MTRRRTRATGASALALSLLVGLAGCRHKAPEPPPVAVAPPLNPATSITVITPLPSVPAQAKADVQPAPPPAPAPVVAAAPVRKKRHIRHRQTPANVAVANTAAPAAAVPGGTDAITGTAAGNKGMGSTAASGDATGIPGAATLEAPSIKSTSSSEAAPALGELSTGTAISSRERTRMLDEIQVQATRLGRVKELSTQDERILGLQIHTFLDRARQAVSENDLDGAQTLTTKARVLLDELQSE